MVRPAGFEPTTPRLGKQVCAMNLVSVLCIVPQSSGLFKFDPEGEPAAIARIYDRNDELVDFVAWHPDNPGIWWLRNGDETPLLGTRNLAMAAYYGDPIRLYSTPQDWLIAGRKGACVVKWDWPLNDLFYGVGDVECSSAPLQRKLIASLRRWEPRVVVRKVVRHAA